MALKPEIEQVEDITKEIQEAPVHDDIPIHPYTAEEEKAVLRKLDLNLLPLMFVLYSLSVLDRSNLGNAKIAGMADDIDLSGRRYTWLATMFYIAYIIFQFSTMGWKIFRPHRWIGSVVFFWGFVSTIQAVTTNWAGLMICRFFLGMAETMFGPGVPVYLSYFYPREKMGLRLGIFLSGSALANAYGGALAYALSHIHSHISNWRFLFIVEGVPTCLLALAAWFFCPDSPADARFLTRREREVASRIAEKQPGDFQHSGLQFRQLFDAFKDYRSYFIALMNFSCNVSFASLPLFLPTIILEMGDFSALQSNGLSAPPYLLCFIFMVGAGALSDRLRMRGPFVVFGALMGAAGFLILATTSATAPRYFGIFLAVNIFVATSSIFPWVCNNTATDSKRVGGFWIMQTVGQCGPLLGTNIFPEEEGPYYRKGVSICCAFCALVAVLASTLSYLLWRENRKKDRLYGKATREPEKIDVAEQLDGDKDFRYMI